MLFVYPPANPPLLQWRRVVGVLALAVKEWLQVGAHRVQRAAAVRSGDLVFVLEAFVSTTHCDDEIRKLYRCSIIHSASRTRTL